jgi:tetratricopeptide (TPR) repeat protein
MLRDAQGMDVTTDSTETLAAINRYADESLRYGNDALTILKGIEADPTCAIANAYAATFYLCQETAKARRQAVPYLEAAKAYSESANERETLYIRAIEAWATGAIDKAIAYHEAIAQKFPRDLLSVQMGQYHYFYQGNKKDLLRIALQVLPANRDNHYLYGMIAFGLEQCHRLQEAEEVGRLATQMNRHDPWAHHAVAHVMETQGRIDEGIAWMESLSDTWKHCNSMLYTHNWWHIALYYLEKEDFQTVLALYDSHIWGRATKESSKDQIGAIQVLLRLELRGVDVGNHWKELAAYLSLRIHEHTLPFQDLHYVYALARAGETDLVTEMLLSIQEYATTTNPYLRRTWTEVALPAARGMIAHATGEWENAIAQLRPTLPRLSTIGGSHAQHDLFEQVYLDAWLRAEHNYEAFHLLQKRIATRRFVPSMQRGLAFTN